MRIGNLEIDLSELATFIADAKRNCYAGKGKEEFLPDGSKRLIYIDPKGKFWYEDNYDGYYQAPGRELVRWQKEDGQRIWQMSYSGGMKPEFFGQPLIAEATFSFLKKVLSQVTPQRPFRGPARVEDDLLLYINEVDGDITRFKSKSPERIIWDPFGETFSQDYVGGLVIPK